MPKIKFNKDNVPTGITLVKGESMVVVIIDKEGKRYSVMKVDSNTAPAAAFMLGFYKNLIEQKLAGEMLAGMAQASKLKKPGKDTVIPKLDDKDNVMYIG